MFRKQTGVNPLILQGAESPMGYVTFLLKLLAVVTGFSVACFTVCPSSYLSDGVFKSFDNSLFKGVGLALFFISLILTALSQIQMGKSWRVGIDTERKTELVRQGFYRYSRNPIYLGIMISLFGFFLILPNRLNLVINLYAFAAFGMLIRLEEEHMRSLHGSQFEDYCKLVRRWI